MLWSQWSFAVDDNFGEAVLGAVVPCTAQSLQVVKARFGLCRKLEFRFPSRFPGMLQACAPVAEQGQTKSMRSSQEITSENIRIAVAEALLT